MRVIAACLLGFLGLAGLSTMAACSDATDAGSGGAAGSSGASPGGKAGATSSAGTGGSAQCGFQTTECSACLGEKCGDQVDACGAVNSCRDALLLDLPKCVCDPSQDANDCVGTFVTENGDLAEKLANCYTLNCEDACQ
jgi:hypothetical protein